MSDVVNELRVAQELSPSRVADLCAEAADEIECLRAEIAEISERKGCPTPRTCSAIAKENELLRAEIAAKDAALARTKAAIDAECHSTAKELAAKDAEIARLREALEHYACDLTEPECGGFQGEDECEHLMFGTCGRVAADALKGET